MSTTSGNIAVIGSTGSIGKQTLDVVRLHPERFAVKALAARRDVETLKKQAIEFRPEYIAVVEEDAAAELRSELGPSFVVESGEEALCVASTLESVQIVMTAVVGFAGLRSVLAAIASNKHVALANKESLVAGGELVNSALKNSHSVLVPVDSEHSSIFQCLCGKVESDSPVRIVLTASGGPFLNLSASCLRDVGVEDALKHPRWNMGAKISIDSATMMNKGLEVIEASWLFGMPGSMIDVLVHPQSIVHGLVEYEDGVMIAAMSQTDMRVPIAFALGRLLSNDPQSLPGTRIKSGVSSLDLLKSGPLEFFEPDRVKFRALDLCYQALAQGNGATTVVNAANEEAVAAFLREEISFVGICGVVERTLDEYCSRQLQCFEDIVMVDSWARKCASQHKIQFSS